MISNINDFKKINENNNNEEQLYHEINWDELFKSVTDYASVFPEEEKRNIILTYYFIKDNIEKYKMTN